MEEDIKRLEEFIKYLNLHGNYCATEYLIKEKESIENLIKRNKELEEIEKEHQKENGKLREKIKDLEESAKRELLLEMPDGIYLKSHILGRHDLSWQRDLNDFISKPKIKEKIEELKEKEEEMTDEQGYWGSSELLYKIQVLEALLEDK